jgi:hypothetical protein
MMNQSSRHDSLPHLLSVSEVAEILRLSPTDASR